MFFFFFFNDTATTEIYTLSLHDALPISLGNVTASVYYYPAPASGLFLTGGLGLSDYRLSDGGSITGAGWGFTAGTGYDIRVGRNVSLTPVVNFAYGHVGDLSSGGTTVDAGWKQSVIDFALGVTFH